MRRSLRELEVSGEIDRQLERRRDLKVPSGARARRRQLAVGLVILCLAALLRVAVLRESGLWADELFSLAMATGHSLEHPAASAQPAYGDYVESAAPVEAGKLARYLAPETPPAGLRSIVRAVFTSDTDPPLYYLLLASWMRAFGASDAALRAFSLVASLAALPVVAGLARRLGGRRAVSPALFLYAVSPVSVFFSSEGRMYSLLWLLTSAQMAATLALRRRGARGGSWLRWSALAALGLLTHYFFVFPLAACLLWLASQWRRVSPRRLGAALAVVALGIAPWYTRIPASLSLWRVTAGWQDGFPEPALALAAPFRLVSSLLSGYHLWWGGGVTEWPLALLFTALLVMLFLRGSRRATAIALPWLAACCFGLLVFDFWRGTYCVLVARYALAGLPAVVILAAAAAARAPRALRAGVLLAFTVLWLPELGRILASPTRKGQPFLQAARELDRNLGARDLIVAQSIPSGVAGLARYLSGPAPVLSWVEQLGVRAVPRDLERWVPRARRVAFVRIHTVGAPEPAGAWLAAHLEHAGTWQVEGAMIDYYRVPSSASARTRNRAASGRSAENGRQRKDRIALERASPISP